MHIRREFDELKNSGRLPSPTGVGLQILALTQSDDWSVDELVHTVSADPALTGRIIKLANSAISGSTETVSSLAQAAMRVGARTVSNQALGFTLVTGNRQGQCEGFDYDGFWSESLARAVSAQLLARWTRASPAEAFTCGLLSRVGELALASVHASTYAEILLRHREDPDSDLRALEADEFAIDNREVSMAMISDWGMPEWFVEAIGHFELEHGEDVAVDSRATELIGTLRMAKVLAALCDADEDQAVKLWSQIDRVREELQLEAGQFQGLCDEVSEEWVEWGKLLDVATSAGVDVRRVESRAKAEDDAGTMAARFVDDEEEGEDAMCLRVLAVDDEPISLKLLERHLRSAGHQVFTARDGREALQATLNHAPHVVISDWMMPEMDGIELCESLRRARAGRDIYFLLVTGRGEEDKVVQAFEAGIDDYVVKPFNPKILMARVRAGKRLVLLREQVEREQRIQREHTAKLGVMARKLRDAASTDPLTELPNRRYGMQRLAEEWAAWVRSGQRLALVMADIDHFKAVNDTYGHDIGDEVLKAVAVTMRSSVRAIDICARIGGEEFLVICPETDVEGGRSCAERVRAAVEANEVEAGAFSGNVTMSIGVAVADRSVADMDALLKLADEAVYRAKWAGRNRIEIAPTGDSRAFPESA